MVALLDELGRSVDARRSGARRWLHHGATSQDALDSAMIMCLAPLVRESIACLGRSREAAAALARTHERSPILARTLLQAAGLTTFGAKAALWSAALGRSTRRVAAAADRGLSIQLAGPVGTGQMFGDDWIALQREVARALALGVPGGGAWQSVRDDWITLLVQLAGASAVATRIANDVALMCQSEIGEVSEPPAASPMSSALPHKQNPVLSMRIRACGLVVTGHAAAVLGTLASAEHERSLGAWQAELAVAPLLVAHASSALGTLAVLLEGLRFHADRARDNIDRTGGLIFADRAVAELSAVLPGDSARAYVDRACRDARATGSHLREALERLLELDGAGPPGERLREALTRALDPTSQVEASVRAARRALEEPGEL
jgi:3-carboxy-cis,cis-muconate cycloisomerase